MLERLRATAPLRATRFGVAWLDVMCSGKSTTMLDKRASNITVSERPV